MQYAETLSNSLQMAELREENAPKLMDILDRYIIANIGEDLTLENMSNTVKISKFALTRLFHKHYKQAPMRWLWSFRAHIAKDVIQMDLGLPLMDVLTLCGFNSPQHFSRFFRKTFQHTPSALLRNLNKEPTGPRDVQRLQQELYEAFDRVVISSLERYKATFKEAAPV
jgi:transcriptional regulator GlxA family with amidase domain